MGKTIVAPATGRLGVLCIGNGGVASTLFAAIEAIKQGVDFPLLGSLTQVGHIRLGKRDENRFPLIKDFLPLASLNDIVFGAWDIYSDNALVSAQKAGVLSKDLLQSVDEQLTSIVPMAAAFDQDYVRELTDGDNIKVEKNKMVLADQVQADILEFKTVHNCDRLIMLCVSSTESFVEIMPVHETLKAFENGLYNDDPNISPSQIYAYAALQSGVSVINGTPNCIDIPAIVELANNKGLVVCGKDFKTGQTLVKTVLADMFRSRCLQVENWYSTNILGNRDGAALRDPGSFHSKEKTKGDVLASILKPGDHPEIYGGKVVGHQVHIHFVEAKGDQKEGWDNILFTGFGGAKMSMKIDIQCQDSPLAAALCVDLILLMDLAQRAGKKGVQEFLSYYFKAPQTHPGIDAVHALSEQEFKLLNWMRELMGEEVITSLGLDYVE